MNDRFVEVAEVAQHPGQVGSPRDEAVPAQAELAEIADGHQSVDAGSDCVGRPTKLAAHLMDLRKLEHHENLTGFVAGLVREVQRTLTRVDGLVVLSQRSEAFDRPGNSPALSASIAEHLRDALGLPHAVQCSTMFAQVPERYAQVETEAEPQILGVATLGKVPKSVERLLQPDDRLAVRRAG